MRASAPPKTIKTRKIFLTTASVLWLNFYWFKGSVSPDFSVFFIIYDIKSVLSVWTLMLLNFFKFWVLLIFKDEVLMYMAQNAS